MARRDCPECGTAVKAENLREHYARVHPLAAPPKGLPPPGRSKPSAPRLSRKREGYAYLIVALVVILVVAFAVWPRSPPGPTEAPDFYIHDTDGAAVTLVALRGQYVLLDLMSTSCGVCQRFTRDTLTDIYQDYRDRIRWLSVDLNREGDNPTDGMARILTFKATYGATWQYALDTDSVAAKYKVYDNGGGTPTTVIVDRSGTIVYRHVGFESIQDFTAVLDGFVGG